MLAGAPGMRSKIALTAPPATVEVYKAPKQDQARRWLKFKRKRDQQGHGHGRRQARCRAKDQAKPDCPQQQQGKIHRR